MCSEERVVMSDKLGKIIEESLKGFFKVHSHRVGNTTRNVGDAEGLKKALRFLENWGIEYENLWNLNAGAALFERIRLKMNNKVCVDAPKWFSRYESHCAPPTILYVPEKLALRMLTLNYLPNPEGYQDSCQREEELAA